MIQQRSKTFALSVLFVMFLSLAACTKKVAKVTPPAAPAPAAPSATLAANPSAIEQGQETVLTWETMNATEITIAGLGALPPSGSRSVRPSASTTYTLVATGPGGSKDASARVTVNPTVAKTTSRASDEDLFRASIKDVFFDYDKSTIRADQVPSAQGNAGFLLQHPNVKVLIEGHCDDRGSEEYNLALGTSRAESVRESLLQQGVSADHIKTVSYGKERPFCAQENEECWQQNRVDHFVFQR